MSIDKKSEKDKKDDNKRSKTTIHPDKAGKKRKRLARIERIDAPEKIVEGEEVTIVVSGSLPHAGWKVAKSTTEIKGKDIFVSIIRSSKPGMMAAQVITPFQTTVKIAGLKKGKYTVQATEGPAEKRTIKITKK